MPGKPPSTAKPGFDVPTGGPATPHVVESPNGNPCGARKTILRTIPLTFYRLAGKWDTDIEDASKVSTRIGVQLSHTKKRVFARVEAEVASYDPSGGQTGYYARARAPTLFKVPDGCEIASISTATKGAVYDVAPPTLEGRVPLPGNGPIEEARCTYSETMLPKSLRAVRCDVYFREVQVQLKPATNTCPVLPVDVSHASAAAVWRLTGDWDMEGERVGIDFSLTVTNRVDSGKVTMFTDLVMQQVGGDGSKFESYSPLEELYDLKYDAPGCRLPKNSVFGRLTATSSKPSDARPQQYTPLDGTGGALRHASCSTGRPGEDMYPGAKFGANTTLYCGLVDFEPFNIVLEHDPKAQRKRRARKIIGW